MKKRVVIGIVLAAVLATVPVTQTFADSPVHPGGLGIGVLWGMGWGGSDWGSASNIALSLKLPTMPVFWGINLGIGNNWFSIGVQGDVYFMGGYLVDTLLGWFLGFGLYGNFGTSTASGVDAAIIGFGARLPIGLTFQLANFFEIFLNMAPTLGLGIWTAGSGSGLEFPHGGIFNFEIGLRLWL